MKILHVLATPRSEGTPNLVLDWLATGKHEQEVFVMHAEPADLTDRLRAGAQWYREEMLFSRGWKKFFGISWAICRVCRERKPDVVVCWVGGFGNWVCLGARLGGVRNVWVHAGNPPNRNPKEDWMTRYVMLPISFLGGRVVCCSRSVMEEFQAVPGVPRELFVAIYNCVRGAEVARRAAVTREKRASTGQRIGVMVATLEAHKDHRTLIRAMALLALERPDFKLKLLGDGTLRKPLENEVRSLGLEECVEFLGSRKDVPEILGETDIFILSTTEQEGFGSVLLEALAAGLPVVASDVRACREVLVGGKYGTLVPPGDEKMLAQAIIKLVQTGGLDDKGVEYAMGFTPEKMIDQYLELIR